MSVTNRKPVTPGEMLTEEFLTPLGTRGIPRRWADGSVRTLG